MGSAGDVDYYSR
jgi:hypothetical protein